MHKKICGTNLLVVLNARYNKRNTDKKLSELNFLSVFLLLCIAY